MHLFHYIRPTVSLSVQDYTSIGNFLVGILNMGILAVTGWIVWKYTQAADRNNEIQEEPLVSLTFDEKATTPGDSTGGAIILKNIGRGPAYSVTVSRIILGEYSYNFYLHDTILEPQEKTLLRAAVKMSSGGMEGFSMKRFIMRFVPQNIGKRADQKPILFIVRYTGANNKDYHSVFAFYSELPPGDDMIMQFIVRGNGSITLEESENHLKNTELIESPVVG